MSACRQADKVKLEIAEARSEIMAPLSAASMESYSRAYPYLVKLHMLQVISLATNCLALLHCLTGPHVLVWVY